MSDCRRVPRPGREPHRVSLSIRVIMAWHGLWPGPPAGSREKIICSSTAAVHLRGPPARPGQTQPGARCRTCFFILNGEDSESPGRGVQSPRGNYSDSRRDNAGELPDFPDMSHIRVHSDRFLLGEMKTAKILDCKTRKMQGIYIQSTWYHAHIYIFCTCKGELQWFVQTLDQASIFASK